MSALDTLARFPKDSSPFELLPQVGLLSRSDSWQDLRTFRLQAPLEEYINRDVYPIPCAADREGYNGHRHFDYWLTGLYDFLNATLALKEHGKVLGAGDEVLDLGCASGRTLRQFAANVPDVELWGIDINQRHIEFCQRHLDPRIKAVQGTVLPHLPIADSSLSLVCAFSVFTHIDAFETAWLSEIRRVLRPGGFAYLTIHSERNWEEMNPKFPLYHALLNRRELWPELNLRPASFQQPMPHERIVFSMTAQPHAPCNVFHTCDYIHRVWGRFLTVREIYHERMNPQDSVLLEKTN